jgi:hypothetical protein
VLRERSGGAKPKARAQPRSGVGSGSAREGRGRREGRNRFAFPYRGMVSAVSVAKPCLQFRAVSVWFHYGFGRFRRTDFENGFGAVSEGGRNRRKRYETMGAGFAMVSAVSVDHRSHTKASWHPINSHVINSRLYLLKRLRALSGLPSGSMNTRLASRRS